MERPWPHEIRMCSRAAGAVRGTGRGHQNALLHSGNARLITSLAFPSTASSVFAELPSLAPASPPLPMTGCLGLTDSRQLFAAEHINNPVPTDAALQEHRPPGSLFYPADAHRTFRYFNPFQNTQRGFHLRGGDECCKSSFVRYIQRIKPQNFACALHNFMDWDQG